MGSVRAKQLEQRLRKVLKQLQLPAHIEHVDNIDVFLERDIQAIPALFLQDKKLVEGTLPSSKELFVQIQACIVQDA